MDDGVSVEVVDGGHDAVLELLFGCDSDVAQDGAGELGEETLDEIEPGAVLGREDEFESTGRLLGEPSLGLLGDVRRMIVEDQLDRCVGGLAASRSLRNSMNSRLRWRSLTRAWTWPVSRSMPASKLTVPWRLYSGSRAKVACLPGSGGRSGAVVAIA